MSERLPQEVCDECVKLGCSFVKSAHPCSLSWHGEGVDVTCIRQHMDTLSGLETFEIRDNIIAAAVINKHGRCLEVFYNYGMLRHDVGHYNVDDTYHPPYQIRCETSFTEEIVKGRRLSSYPYFHRRNLIAVAMSKKFYDPMIFEQLLMYWEGDICNLNVPEICLLEVVLEESVEALQHWFSFLEAHSNTIKIKGRLSVDVHQLYMRCLHELGYTELVPLIQDWFLDHLMNYAQKKCTSVDVRSLAFLYIFNIMSTLAIGGEFLTIGGEPVKPKCSRNKYEL